MRVDGGEELGGTDFAGEVLGDDERVEHGEQTGFYVLGVHVFSDALDALDGLFPDHGLHLVGELLQNLEQLVEVHGASDLIFEVAQFLGHCVKQFIFVTG